MGEKVKEKNQNEIVKVAKDIFASTVAGVTGLAATHPIDTIRIRMQLQGYPKMYKTWFHCGAKAIQREGIGGLFKGIISNSLNSASIYSVCFTANAFANRMVASLDINQDLKLFI